MDNQKEFQLPYRGPKLCAVDKNNVDKEKLSEEANKKINHHKSLFSISSPRHLRSVAVFKSQNDIDVIKRNGKMFQYFGTQTKDSYKLLPEETLFLLEMNYLELQWNSIPMSVQQGYAVLLDENNKYCKLRHYRIYSHLLRKSYRMIRHKPISWKNDSGIEEDSANISPVSKKAKLQNEENPLIRPLIDESITDIDTALQRLQIFNTNPVQNQSIDFVYDGYHPQREFCKRNIPPEPDISVNYACPNEHVPTVSQENNRTKLLFALEGTKDIVYYCVKHVNVKNLLQD